jgi:hypothetical protein
MPPRAVLEQTRDGGGGSGRGSGRGGSRGEPDRPHGGPRGATTIPEESLLPVVLPYCLEAMSRP